MLYFKQKLKLYRKITGLTYPELAELLDVPMSSLFYTLNKGKTTPNDLVSKFSHLLTRVREHLLELDKKLNPEIKISTFWPELYAPFLYDVSHLVAKNGVWHFVRKGLGTPVYKNGVWQALREDQPTPWNLSTAPLPAFIVPEWPLADEFSCLRQTEDGWIKTKPLDAIDESTAYQFSTWAKDIISSKARATIPAATLKLYGKWHIPGNSETSEFQQVVETFYKLDIPGGNK